MKVVVTRSRRGGRCRHRHPPQRGRPDRDRLRPRRRDLRRSRAASTRQGGVREPDESRPRERLRGRRPRGRRRLPRPLDAGSGLEGRSRADGGRCDRLRDGEPDTRDRAGGSSARQGRGRRNRPLRLPEPDQQRARVPGRVPRSARRACEHDHRGHEGRCGPRDRIGDRRRRARAGVRDPERVQPRRDAGRRGSGRRGSRARRRRATHELVPSRCRRAGPSSRPTRSAELRAG